MRQERVRNRADQGSEEITGAVQARIAELVVNILVLLIKYKIASDV